MYKNLFKAIYLTEFKGLKSTILSVTVAWVSDSARVNIFDFLIF